MSNSTTELPIAALEAWMSNHVGGEPVNITQVTRFPGGFSNLTYLLSLGDRQLVLRRAPLGADVKGGHDMGREHKVLSLLHPVFGACPTPLGYCEDEQVIGAPFFLMEHVEGKILRPSAMNNTPSPEEMKRLCTSLIGQLAALHSIDIETSGLMALGKPEGYQQRQTSGWIDRYERARTDEIPGVEALCTWLTANVPPDGPTTVIHNDFKFDNVVFSSIEEGNISAILDWEMATVGHPGMDLGTTLAYWVEAGDGPFLKPFNITHLPGALTRQEVLAYYEQISGLRIESPVFYYAFGLFKVGVIAQQIYARYRKGLTTDKRFASLGLVVKACMEQAIAAVERGKL